MRHYQFEEIREHVECMLLMGMKIGEIQAVLGSISAGMIRDVAKEIGISIEKNISSTSRNIAGIRSYLSRYIKDPIKGMNVDKMRILYEKIETLAPTPSGRAGYIRSINSGNRHTREIEGLNRQENER